MLWYVMGWDGMRWDEMGWDEMVWYGVVWYEMVWVGWWFLVCVCVAGGKRATHQMLWAFAGNCAQEECVHIALKGP